MPEEKVSLKPIEEDQLVELTIYDTQQVKKSPIPLPLVKLAEKCLPIYKRFKKTYQDKGIDYSESGDKTVTDIEEAIKKIRNLEIDKMTYEDKRLGLVTTWHFPPVDGDATILLTQFVSDVLSLTRVPETSIKIRLERDVIGIRPVDESEAS